MGHASMATPVAATSSCGAHPRITSPCDVVPASIWHRGACPSHPHERRQASGDGPVEPTRMQPWSAWTAGQRRRRAGSLQASSCSGRSSARAWPWRARARHSERGRTASASKRLAQRRRRSWQRFWLGLRTAAGSGTRDAASSAHRPWWLQQRSVDLYPWAAIDQGR